jgi:hypothetical protein
MSVIARSVATPTAVTWSYLALARGPSGVLSALSSTPVTGGAGGFVAVVPARNEAEQIGAVLNISIKSGVAMPVLFVDDESTEGILSPPRMPLSNCI